MPLLVPVPQLLIKSEDFKDDFGISASAMTEMHNALNKFYSDEEILKREAEKAVLTAQKKQLETEIKTQCEAYNEEIEKANNGTIVQEDSDIILIGSNGQPITEKLNCDDMNSLSGIPAFSGQVNVYNEINNKLVTIDEVDSSVFIPIPSESTIDEGIIKGQKKLLRALLAHALINAVYKFDFDLLIIRNDLGLPVSQIISKSINIQTLNAALTLMKNTFRVPFGHFGIQSAYPALNPDMLTLTCAEMYKAMKKLNEEQTVYLKKQNKEIQEYYSNENVENRSDEFEQIKDTYESKLRELIDVRKTEIQNLKEQFENELNNVQIIEDTGDEILIGGSFIDLLTKELVFGGEQIITDDNFIESTLRELSVVDDYIDAITIDYLQENVDKIKTYSDFIRSNIVKSYLEFKTVEELHKNSLVNAETFNSLIAKEDLVDLGSKYNALDNYVSNLIALNDFDKSVLDKSIELIFDITSIAKLKNFIPYYDDNTDNEQKIEIKNDFEVLKPQFKAPAIYDIKAELAVLCDEINTDFSAQKPNHYTPRIMFSQGQTDYVISRVNILKKATSFMLGNLKTDTDDLKQQILSEEDEEDIPPLQAELDSKNAESSGVIVSDDCFVRLNLYYKDKPLQYTINTDLFKTKTTIYQSKLQGTTVDENDNQVPDDIDSPLDVTVEDLQLRYEERKKEFDALVLEKITATNFTFSVKNFTGSDVKITINGSLITESKFESDYKQISTFIIEFNNMDSETAKFVKSISDTNKQAEEYAIKTAEETKKIIDEKKDSVQYSYSKKVILLLINEYRKQQEEINKKIEERKKEIEKSIEDKKKEIEELQKQLLLNSEETEDQILISNIQNNIDEKKRLLEEAINALQNELDNLPEKIDVAKLTLAVRGIDIVKKEEELKRIEEQLEAGFSGFKPFPLPENPFDIMREGIYQLVKAYMLHTYMFCSVIVYVYANSIPWTTIAKFIPVFLEEHFLRITTDKIVKDLKKGGTPIPLPPDILMNINISTKINRHLCNHLINNSKLKTNNSPKPELSFWYLIPPYTIPPPFSSTASSGKGEIF